MTDKKSSPRIPEGYKRIEGSDRRPSAKARLLGPADPSEKFSVTIVLRRRPDGPPIPDHDFFLTTPPHQRQRMPADEFAAKYGALPTDIDKVVAFARAQGLEVVETHPARRTVVVSGTVAQMEKSFAVKLGRYEHEVVRRHGEKPRTETYRGRDGFVHVPADLAEIVVGIFGLDNRRITKLNGGDPPNTNTISIIQATQLYNFPNNSAAGQTIGLFCGLTEDGDGYDIHDIQNYFAGLPSSHPMPTLTDISVHGSNSGSDPFGEITQDIDISATAAPGAAIAVYFTTHTQQGWVDCIDRVVHPLAGDPVCSVLSSSYFASDRDDAGGLDLGVTVAWINAVSEAFRDAAIQGITVCIASGDTGSDSRIGDGNAHVQYPVSDPWVLAVGGTTIGNVSGSSFDEYVWNDDTGATGGGISDFFSLPSYQSGATVPRSVNDNHAGRGVPDVAANASPNSGYPITIGGSSATANGTSASAPLWAGLIAVINAAVGSNVGFVNPAIYALGSSGFRDIVGSPGPADNGFNGVTGYPAGSGWDACTGWGSPNGVALLNGLRSIYNRTMYFIVDKSTYGYDEVSDVIAVGGGLYSSALWVVLEGFSISQLGSTAPTLGGAFKALSGVSIFMGASGPEYEAPGDLYTPQRIRFPYNIIFGSSTTTPAPGIFPAAGAGPLQELLTASITIAGASLSAEAEFELVSGADPYFTNIDPAHNNVFYLSQDLRVFSTAAGSSPLPGAPAFTSDPYASIQSLVHFLNSNSAYTTPGADQLNGLPGQTGYETGDSSVTPLTPGGQKNFNFAIARVRLQDAGGSTAPRARVFFRLFVAQSCDTDFQSTTTYLSDLGTSGADNGKPVFPKPSGTGLVDPFGQSIQTIPYFATDATGTHDYDGTNSDANIRDIQIPSGQDKVWAYYGCFLDVYDASDQFKFPGTHHCIVAEIAYDDAPIVNSNGVTMSPENSDKLAQRNLQITLSGNPGYPETHRIPQAFDTRPSPVVSQQSGLLLDYPDELMIDWGNTPAGSIANIYWPQVNAQDVLKLAAKLYGTHPFSAADANTILCKTRKGISYLPIPHAAAKNFAGLFTLDLPNTIHIGQEFNIKVRRISTRRPDPRIVIEAQRGYAEKTHSVWKREFMRNWRYVTGTFQVQVPVGNDKTLLLPEENTLAIMKWRLEHMSPAYRWYPVLQRYIAYVSGRVTGFGGDPGKIKPSPTGFPGGKGHGGEGPGEKRVEYTGKICALVYDRFGDFEGFILDTEDGDRRFTSPETEIELVVNRALAERIVTTVVVEIDAPHRPESILLRCPPRPFHLKG